MWWCNHRSHQILSFVQVSYKKLKKDIKRIPPIYLRSFRGSSGSMHGGADQERVADGQRTPRRRSSASLGNLIHRSQSRRFEAGADYITVSPRDVDVRTPARLFVQGPTSCLSVKMVGGNYLLQGSTNFGQHSSDKCESWTV